jgi:molecular chaperone GrpE (heat shock protein)
MSEDADGGRALPDQRPTDEAPPDQRPTDEATPDQRPSDEAPPDQRPTDVAPTDQPDQRPADEGPLPTGSPSGADAAVMPPVTTSDDSTAAVIPRSPEDEAPAPSGASDATEGDDLENNDLALSRSVMDAVDSLARSIEELRVDFKRAGDLGARQGDLLVKLNSENERLQQAELERSRDPLVRDLIALAGTCLRNGRAWGSKPAAGPADVEKVLNDVAQDIELILSRQGIESFAPAAGDPFNRREQRTVHVDETSDATVDGAIAVVLRPGYRFGDRVLVYAEVAVWKFAKSPTADEVGVEAEGPPTASSGG